jgi:hypothetical protein
MWCWIAWPKLLAALQQQRQQSRCGLQLHSQLQQQLLQLLQLPAVLHHL